jgi:Transposase DDE domain
MAADLGGMSSPGKNSAHIRKAVSAESTPMMSASRRRSSMSRVLAASPFIAKIWRGEAAVTRKPGGYAGKLVTWARTKLKPRLTLQIVKRPGDLHTFQVLPRRWVVERTLAWITRCRRTVRDYERLPEHHETPVYWAMTITMTRRLARRPAA